MVYSEKNMTIDNSRIGHVMSILTNLYAEPYDAVLQEYFSNAIDSHTRAGQQKPVRITLPDYKNNQVLTIQDFGTGMSEDELKNIYGSYSTSTKTSDPSQIGKFGAGAKSALAITDKFTGISVKDGLSWDFIMEYDNVNSYNRIPVFKVSSPTPTSEPNGFTVRIPYSADLQETHVIQRFAGFPHRSYSINGRIPDSSISNPNVAEIFRDTDGNVSVSVMKYKKGNPVQNVFFVVGGVKFLADFDKLNLSREKEERVWFCHDTYITVPISAVVPTPSREALVYNKYTIPLMRQVVLDALDLMKTQNESEFLACETFTEAQKYVLDWEEKTSLDSNLANNIWRNKKIVTNLGKNFPDYVTTLSVPEYSDKKFYTKTYLTLSGFFSPNVLALTVDVDKITGRIPETLERSLRFYFKYVMANMGYKRIYLFSKIPDELAGTPAFNREENDIVKFIEMVKKHRSDARKRMKASVAHGGTPDSSVPASLVSLPYLSLECFNGEKEMYFSRVTSSDVQNLNTELVFFVISKSILVEGQWSGEFYQEVRSSSSKVSSSAKHNAVSKLYLSILREYVSGAEFKVLVVPHNVSLNAFKKKFPNAVDAESIVLERCDDEVSKLTNMSQYDILHCSGSYITYGIMSDLVKFYKANLTLGKISPNALLDEFLSCDVENENSRNITLYRQVSGYKSQPSSDFLEKVLNIATEIKQMCDNLSVLHNMFSYDSEKHRQATIYTYNLLTS